MKTLSAANESNISAIFQDADVLVEMPGISKQWSTKTRASYETRITKISPLRQTIDPLGGLASWSDFTITIQQETPTQFVQDLDVDGEAVNVYLQYGADAKITLIKGKLDRWEFKAGDLILHCTSDTGLESKLLPTTQLNATSYSSFTIPPHLVGRWVPLTIGLHDKAFGLIADGVLGAQKLLFNAAVSGHLAVDDEVDSWVYISQAREFVKILTVLVENTAGYLQLVSGTWPDVGYVVLTLETIPITATKTDGSAINSGMRNPTWSRDDDFDTYSEARAITPLNQSRTVILEGRLRSFQFPDQVVVIEDQLYILADMDRTEVSDDTTPEPINDGSDTLETCEAAIELVDGTYPADASLIIDVLADGESAFDNLNEMDDAETDLAFDVSDYAAKIGLDLDGDGTKDTLPVARLSGRNLDLKYTEEWNTGGDLASLKIQEWRLRIDMRAYATVQEFFSHLEGYNDDAGGTYTGGGADTVIENPADVIHFLLTELLGATSINTTRFSDARDDLGSYVVAGQVLDLKSAEQVLGEIAGQGRLKLFIDLDDQWSVRSHQIPGTEDRHLSQSGGDFVTTDGRVEGEILSVTQSSLSELYNQFEILYAWNQGTRVFEKVLILDETTVGPVGDWLTESQSRYGITRKLTVKANWIRDDVSALSYGHHLVHHRADRKRIVQFRTSWNGVDLEIGDMIRLTHADLQVTEDTTVYAGYRAGDPLATIKAGYTDPDTSATIKAGAKVELNEGRHRYEVYEIETRPLEGAIHFTGRQADLSRAPLPEPAGITAGEGGGGPAAPSAPTDVTVTPLANAA